MEHFLSLCFDQFLVIVTVLVEFVKLPEGCLQYFYFYWFKKK